MSEGSAKAPQKDPEKGTAKPRKFQAIKGTRDILPPETALWNRVEQTAHEVFATYGFGEIRLPIFEETELFARSIGLDTDVVSKEMYSFEDFESSDLLDIRNVIVAFDESHVEHEEFLHFINLSNRFVSAGNDAFERGQILRTPENRGLLDRVRDLNGSIYESRFRGDREISPRVAEIKDYVRQIRFGDSLTLRPEATASVCRAYIEHGMQTLPQPVKLYYMGPMFRRERPQKGRYRQFYQIGAEVLGGPDAPAVDAELIEMLMVFFGKLGLEGAKLYINSIGDKECRPKYVELLRRELLKVKEKLGPDSQRRIETNPLRVLDSKLESEQEIIEKLPRIAEHLCEPCRQNYDEVKKQLARRGVTYSQNFRLVRGLDYYVRTTFEITAPGLGAQNAVCGGGRYDGLVELLGGPPTKGTGFAIGEDRVLLSLQETAKAKAARGLDVFIAWVGESAYAAAIRAARSLREAGFAVELPGTPQKFAKALGQADKLGARYALILGEEEVSSGQWTVKRLADGKQSKLSEADFLKLLKKEQSLSS